MLPNTEPLSKETEARLKTFAAWMELKKIRFTGLFWADRQGNKIANDFEDLIPYYIENEKEVYNRIAGSILDPDDLQGIRFGQ